MAPGKTSSSPTTERLARLVQALQAKHDAGGLLEELGVPSAQQVSFMVLAQGLLRRAERQAHSGLELELAMGVLVALGRGRNDAPSGES